MPPKEKRYLMYGKVHKLSENGRVLLYVCDVADLTVVEIDNCEQLDSMSDEFAFSIESMECDENFLCSAHNRKERRHKPGYEGAQWKQEQKKKYF